MTATSATFVMAFFSFFYANIARFKRFKGLGFEAELWEDKQKEAAELIDRLKAVVSVYTREIILGKVMQGRLSGGSKWSEHWRLYDELVERHTELGQKIDFTDLKKKMDAIFIFDMATPLYHPIREAIWKGRAEAQRMVNSEFGSTIQDVAGYGRRIKQLGEVPKDLDDMFEVSQNGDVAAHILDWGIECKKNLAEHFGTTINFDEAVVKKLENISRIHRGGPLVVTDELISLASRE